MKCDFCGEEKKPSDLFSNDSDKPKICKDCAIKCKELLKKKEKIVKFKLN